MAINIREFLTKWSFQTDTTKLDKMERQLDGIKNRLTLITGIQLVQAVARLGEQFGTFGLELQVTAAAAGDTVEEVQRLQYAAQKSGLSAEELGRGMQILTRHLYDAKNGSAEAVKALSLAGFSGSQINGIKNGTDAILALSTVIQRTADPQKRLAVAVELFGRNGRRAVEFLSKGPDAIKRTAQEADKLGIVLSTKQVAALADLERAFMRLFGLLKSFGAYLASTFGPALTFLIDDFIKFFGVNRDLINLNVQDFFVKLGYGLGYVYGFLKGLTQEVLHLNSVLGFKNLGTALFRLIEVGVAVELMTKAFSVARTVVATFTGVLSLLELVAGVVEAEFIGIAAAVALIVFGIHELYALISGNKTWSESIKNFLNKDENQAGQPGLVGSALAGLAGVSGGLGTSTPYIPIAPLVPGASTSGPVTSDNSSSSTYNLTVNAPNGTAQDIATFVRQQLDILNRQTAAAFKGKK